MEGMICQEMRLIQEAHAQINGNARLLLAWGAGLVTKLLEITHGQWLYRCVQIHDKVRGTLITEHKENLQRQIEEEMDKGWDDLLEEDQYLTEINLEDLENTNGERQEYWLVAICTARTANRLNGGRQTRHQAATT